jgi:hypothetical protein
MSRGIRLNFGGTADAANPFTVTGVVYSNGFYHYGIEDFAYSGHTLPAWTIVNQGFVRAATGNGIYLFNGGSISNASSGSIIGYHDGIDIGRYSSSTSTGVITNAGSIDATTAPACS